MVVIDCDEAELYWCYSYVGLSIVDNGRAYGFRNVGGYNHILVFVLSDFVRIFTALKLT